MTAAIPLSNSSWHAKLSLGYALRGGKTILTERKHEGPLVVQRPLYPEGQGVCHTVVIHPPGGIAGGDVLDLDIAVGKESRVLLTTPGASKWYRSDGREAAQHLSIQADDDTVVEWFPREAIIFDGTHARLTTRIVLGKEALCLGWDILCLGRTASGERYQRGHYSQRVDVFQEGNRLWSEFTRIPGGGPLLASPAGFAGRTIYGTLWAAGRDIPKELLGWCRDISLPPEAVGGVTALPRILLGRLLCDSAEQAHDYFVGLWQALRPALAGSEAVAPRIWST